jgi:hypothetical protein
MENKKKNRVVHDFSYNTHIQELDGINMCRVLNIDVSRAVIIIHIARET